MGMCKKCNEVFNTIDMQYGYCKKCATPELIQKAIEEQNDPNRFGFHWWTIWAWLGLIIGNGYLITTYQNGGFSSEKVLFISLLINTILMIMVLKYNKYAFLIATILSLNPLLWIINGIYLKNRWNHPKINPNFNNQVKSNEIRNNIFEQKKQILYCYNCGNQVNNIDNFCTNCGTKKIN